MTSHTTTELLYFSVAGTCRENVLPTLVAVISGVFNSVNSDPLTVQSIAPVSALQLKVAVDSSVALTDVGVVAKSGVCTNQLLKVSMTIQLHVYNETLY